MSNGSQPKRSAELARLRLYFQEKGGLVLARSVFEFRGDTWKTDRHRDEDPIEWRAGCIAYVWLFVQFALRGAGRESGDAPVSVAVESDSPGKSVLASLDKHLGWRDRVFGDKVSFTDLIRVKRVAGLSRLILNEHILPCDRIEIELGGSALVNPPELGKLAASLKVLWHDQQARRGTPRQGDRARRAGSGGTSGRADSSGGQTLGELVESWKIEAPERKELSDLAAASLSLPADSLLPELAIVVGKAQRAQLTVDVRKSLEIALYRLKSLPWEIKKEPKQADSYEQTRNNLEDLVWGFTEGIKPIEHRLDYWPTLGGLVTEVREALSALCDAFVAPETAADADIKAALGTVRAAARQCARALDAIDAKLNELYIRQLRYLQDVRSR